VTGRAEEFRYAALVHEFSIIDVAECLQDDLASVAHKSLEFSPRCAGELSELPRDFAAETTNGDSPGCTSSNPSPERFDEALCGESPLEKSIAGPEK
jgi:hypothetical protein